MHLYFWDINSYIGRNSISKSFQRTLREAITAVHVDAVIETYWTGIRIDGLDQSLNNTCIDLPTTINVEVMKGVFKGSVGNIIGIKLNEWDASLKIQYIDGTEHMVKMENLTISKQPITFKTRHKNPDIHTNHLNQIIKMDTLVLVYRTGRAEMAYGKVIRITDTAVTFIFPDGETGRTYNMSMIYVPDNQDEFAFEYAVETLKS